jgi:hypothetical protein
MRALLPLLALWVLAPAPLWATQGPATANPAAPQGQPPPGKAPATQAPAAPPAEPADNYTYDPAGRRDPFLDLLSTGN